MWSTINSWFYEPISQTSEPKTVHTLEPILEYSISEYDLNSFHHNPKVEQPVYTPLPNEFKINDDMVKYYNVKLDQLYNTINMAKSKSYSKETIRARAIVWMHFEVLHTIY